MSGQAPTPRPGSFFTVPSPLRYHRAVLLSNPAMCSLRRDDCARLGAPASENLPCVSRRHEKATENEQNEPPLLPRSQEPESSSGEITWRARAQRFRGRRSTCPIAKVEREKNGLLRNAARSPHATIGPREKIRARARVLVEINRLEIAPGKQPVDARSNMRAPSACYYSASSPAHHK